MPRKRSFFTKTNMKALEKKSGKSLITASIVSFILILIVAIVLVSKLRKIMGGYLGLLLFPAVTVFLIPIVLFCMGIGKISDEHATKQAQEQYRKKISMSGIAEIDTMSGKEFEDYLGYMFETLGYKSRVTKYRGDYGADLILEKNEKRIAVQAKRYAKKISVKSVQEISTALKYYNANEGWVVTNNYFTKAAKDLARINGIILIDREKLMEFMIAYKSALHTNIL